MCREALRIRLRGPISTPERLARVSASPTRSGPEGSSRNEPRLGRCQPLTQFPPQFVSGAVQRHGLCDRANDPPIRGGSAGAECRMAQPSDGLLTLKSGFGLSFVRCGVPIMRRFGWNQRGFKPSSLARAVRSRTAAGYSHGAVWTAVVPWGLVPAPRRCA